MNSSSDCPFCLENNLLKGDVLATSDQAFLMQPQPGKPQYLIIPRKHIESPLDLPDNWWRILTGLLATVPDLGANYNVSLNYGRDAGQSIKHLHVWIIVRDASQPTSGKGFARILNELNESHG